VGLMSTKQDICFIAITNANERIEYKQARFSSTLKGFNELADGSLNIPVPKSVWNLQYP